MPKLILLFVHVLQTIYTNHTKYKLAIWGKVINISENKVMLYQWNETYNAIYATEWISIEI